MRICSFGYVYSYTGDVMPTNELVADVEYRDSSCLWLHCYRAQGGKAVGTMELTLEDVLDFVHGFIENSPDEAEEIRQYARDKLKDVFPQWRFMIFIREKCRVDETSGCLVCKQCGATVHVDWFEQSLECEGCDDI